MVDNRAYSVLEIKSVDREQRIIEGIASTPSPDRGGDIMDPAGAVFSLPMSFLWFHDDKNPIGEVFEAKVTPNGIFVRARVSRVTTPGRLKTLVDEAWAAFTADPPLVRGLSIGWKPIESKPEKGGLRRVMKWIWGELSAVTIPMNTDATILSVKAFDQAALGPNTPGVTGTSTVVRVEKDARTMTTQEQIQSFEAKRAANVAAMNALMLKSDGSTLDEEQTEEYTTLEREVESIDQHLPRLRKLETMNVAGATAITATTNSAAASDLRGGVTTTTPRVQVTPMLPKGTAFTRMCMSLAAAKGDSYQAISRAKSYTDTPEVAQMVEATLNWSTKAAVAAGTTTDATWASPLAVAQPLVNEFLELLRPRTIIGRVAGFRQVPFNVSVPSQTGGGTYSWVGQGNAKPVTSATFATVSVPSAKAAGIIVLTEELVRISSPSAEATVRQEMIDGMAAFLDSQLVDPAVAAVANVNPASITNGAATAAASGATAAALRADLAARVATFTAANIPLEGSVWLMNDSNAFAAGISLNALGQPLFPGMSQNGGSIMGIPVIVSNNVGARIILVHAPSILYADEGGVAIDVSREASIQMDSTPANPSDATTVLVSLWQRNLVGLRAERMITWIRARTAAVTYISAAAYTGA